MTAVDETFQAFDLRAALGTDWTRQRPLYGGLARALRTAIVRGEIPNGSRLPAERTLSDTLQVSRSTVVSAYGVLREEGWVRSRRGSGTFASRRTRATDRPLHVSQLVDGVPPTSARQQRAGSDPVNLTVSRPAPLDDLLRTAITESADEIAGVAHDVEYATQGLPRMRSIIAAGFANRGLPTTERQILITTGAQQAITLVAQAFLRPGDNVLLESPTYLGALDAFRAWRTNLIALPASDAPVDVAETLEIASRTDPALLFLMPTCHAITGAVMAAADREALARFCAKSDVMLIEADIFAGLTLEDPEPPPVAAFAPEAPIFTVGSTSKLVWNGLRLGWIRAPERLLARLARMKGMIDLGTSLITQLIATNLLEHTAEIAATRREEIKTRLPLVSRLLATTLPSWRWRLPSGGRSIWAQLPAGDANEFAQEALRYGVIIVSGSALSPTGGNRDRVRLMFVQPPEVLAEGIHRLSLAWETFAPRHVSSAERLS